MCEWVNVWVAAWWQMSFPLPHERRAPGGSEPFKTVGPESQSRSVCQCHKLLPTIKLFIPTLWKRRLCIACLGLIDRDHFMGPHITLYTSTGMCAANILSLIFCFEIFKAFSKCFSDTGLGLHQCYPSISVPRNRILRHLYISIITSAHILTFIKGVKITIVLQES